MPDRQKQTGSGRIGRHPELVCGASHDAGAGREFSRRAEFHPGLLAAHATTPKMAALEKAALSRVPLGRFMQAAEIAGMAVFLASADATSMTGQSIQMDGGMVLC